MKKILSCTLLMTMMVACNIFQNHPQTPPEPETPVTPTTSITLKPTLLRMTVGDVEMLTVTPNSSEIVWSSSDEQVVTVNTGLVTAQGIGTATITATLGKAEATCLVYVSGSAGQTIALNQYLVTLEKGEQFQMICRNTYGSEIEWTSEKPEIASIDANGLITAHKGGLTKIIANSGFETVSANVAVNHTWGEYHLVWEEEFNGTEIDRNTWNIEVNGNGGGNNEAQYYTDRPENLRVENGNLIIQLRKEQYGGRDYTSGRMQTKGKQQFTYGRIEARISFPVGVGTWPAFWMLGTKGGWPSCGEIDIIEHIGSRPNFSSFAVHTLQRNGMQGNNWHAGYTAEHSMENEFHVYGIEWTEETKNGCDQIKFMVDGEVYATIDEEITHVNMNSHWPFNDPHYIILNLAVGGNMGGRIDDSMFEHEVLMKVDWVRVYQREKIDN